MNITALLVAVLASCMAAWASSSGRLPEPFHWVVWGVIVVVWLLVLLMVTGIGSQFHIGTIN